ncbi:hypothetical protein DITRI_Ditri07aG0039200 [Diplodiscus trichospermus]
MTIKPAVRIAERKLIVKDRTILTGVPDNVIAMFGTAAGSSYGGWPRKWEIKVETSLSRLNSYWSKLKKGPTSTQPKKIRSSTPYSSL